MTKKSKTSKTKTAKKTKGYPDVLRLRADGTLFCADGRDVKKYLADHARKYGIDDQVPMNLVTRESLTKLQFAATMASNWAS